MSKYKKKKLTLGTCFCLIALAIIGSTIFFGCNLHAGKNKEEAAKIAQKIAQEPMPEKKVETQPKTTPKLGEPLTGAGETQVPKEQLEVKKGVTYSILIDKSAFTLQLLAEGKVLHTFPIATGLNTGDKKKVGDMRTPDGKFYIEDICDASSWTHDFGDGKGEIKNAYGPWFLSLETPGWTGIGIHGTHDPASIGTRASEGCIRMYNEDLLILKKFVKIGTKVTIQE